MSSIASARPAYKVEELLALRGSASESRVSLEKFPDEDTIKGMPIPFSACLHPLDGIVIFICQVLIDLFLLSPFSIY